MGRAVTPHIEALLGHKDPEVADRAKAILDAFKGDGGNPKWVVEFWKGKTKVHSAEYTGFRASGVRDSSSTDLSTLKALIKTHAPTRLELRFPLGLTAEKQATLLNQIGYSRFPDIRRGMPLTN